MPKRKRTDAKTTTVGMEKRTTSSNATISDKVLGKQSIHSDNIIAIPKDISKGDSLSTKQNNVNTLSKTIVIEKVASKDLADKSGSNTETSSKKAKMYKRWLDRKKTQTHKAKKVVVPEKSVPINTSSSNWEKMRKEIEGPRKKQTKTNKQKQSEKQPTEVEVESKRELKEIWFDDVDEALLNQSRSNCPKTPTSQKTISRLSDSPRNLVKASAYKGLTKAVALDCEMVGVGSDGRESVLARVSVVNQFGQCLYDTFVKSREEIFDYRTKFSGVTPELLEDAANFLDVQKRVSDLIKSRILVGHSIRNDLQVLFLDHPRRDIRDTSRYKPYKDMFKGRTPSLKNLTSRLLNVKIQTGEHNSVIDAQAAMQLYMLNRVEWEKKRRLFREKRVAAKIEAVKKAQNVEQKGT